ncbi:hypothetical protein N2152v2_011122 [Parachlorella kessleri]
MNSVIRHQATWQNKVMPPQAAAVQIAGMVGNNGVSDVLRAAHPGSVRDLVLHFTQESYWGAEKMYESVLETSTQPAFQLQTGGVEYWDWLDQPAHKDERETFARAMLSVSAMHNAALLADLDWEHYASKTIVDVGGGVGGFLAPLLETYPSLRGVLYDRQARELWRTEHPHLLSRARFEAGSFFDSVPTGDVYLLRHVLHDWNSTQALKILTAVRHALAGQNSTLPEIVIAETIMPAQPIGSLLALKDLQMLAMLDGEERSLEQFEELLLGAGLRVAAVASQPAGASSQSRWRPDIWVGGSVLRWVEKFKYLGSHFTHNIDLNTELGYRRSLGAAVFWRLWGPFFSQRCIKLHTRLTVFKVLVLSVVLYGCESLALTCAQQHRLDVFVKGCMRRMLGLRWRDHISDEELYRRCGQEDKPFDSVVVHWRRRSLRFLGHLGRMPESRLAKCILWATLPEGVGRRGRLANPLLPQVYEEHLKQLDLSGARRQQQDKMNAWGGSRVAFNWLSACALKDTWRSLVG